MEYTEYQIYWIKFVYILNIVLWIVIVFCLEIYNKYGSLILLIPIILFMVGIFNANCLDLETSKQIFQTSFIVIGVIFAIPLLTFLNTKNHYDIVHITQLVMIAIILILVSYLHICLAQENIPIWNHCRSCFETMAITLFIYVLLNYFIIDKI